MTIDASVPPFVCLLALLLYILPLIFVRLVEKHLLGPGCSKCGQGFSNV